jgi:hypothetical protein
MKCRIFAAILTLTLSSGIAQSTNSEKTQAPSVENSIFSIETGHSETALLGLWAGYEQRLGNRFTLKTELGINMPGHFRGGYDGSHFNVYLRPVLTIEPRYYLIGRRAAKGRDISNNSGTFFALQTSFSPTMFQTYTEEGKSFIQSTNFTVIPSVGMRRNIGKQFFMEGAIGLGFGYFKHEIQYHNQIDEFTNRHFNLHFRIGYRF